MLNELAAKRIKGLTAYNVNDGSGMVQLDRNESPWREKDGFRAFVIDFLDKTELGIYPDDSCTELIKAISGYTGACPESIIVGNGSDQLIHMTMGAFVDEGDRVAVHTPTFSMYDIYARLCGGEAEAFEADEDFHVDVDEFIEFIGRKKPKMVILCNPNNPTGQAFSRDEIRKILQSFQGVVIVDEAYYEFSGITAVELLKEYKNLIILRTLSKAFGMAGLRVGYAIADREVIGLMSKARPPFNLNSFSQAAALWALRNKEGLDKNVGLVVEERNRMSGILSQIKCIKCYPSDANFLLLKPKKSEAIYESLKAKGILIKSFGKGRLQGCIRITVGAKEINDIVLDTIKEAESYE